MVDKFDQRPPSVTRFLHLLKGVPVVENFLFLLTNEAPPPGPGQRPFDKPEHGESRLSPKHDMAMDNFAKKFHFL